MASRRPSTPTSVYEHLDTAERAMVMGMLLDERPELRTDAERIGAELLADVSADEVAGEVAERLEGLAIEDLASRAGRQPGRGYVHEVEAAYELVEEAVRPLEEDVRRRANAWPRGSCLGEPTRISPSGRWPPRCRPGRGTGTAVRRGRRRVAG